jgi:hypothetical protein
MYLPETEGERDTNTFVLGHYKRYNSILIAFLPLPYHCPIEPSWLKSELTSLKFIFYVFKCFKVMETMKVTPIFSLSIILQLKN